MNDFKEPIAILVILFIVLGFAYKPLTNLKQKRLSGETTTTGSSSIGKGSGAIGQTSNKIIAEDVRDVEKQIKKLEKEASKNYEEKNRSPYYGKIRMSNISGVNRSDPSKEYLTLRASLGKTETINITGWYLKSEITGYYAVIGKAALLPFPYTKTESDVVLQQGDRVTLVKGFSPIGISFRTNKCTGYFEENRTFTPSLPKQCPRLKDEDLPNFSSVYDRNDECIRLIERVPRCTTIGNEYLRDLPDTVPQFCKNYLKTQATYNACVAYHFGDTDFPGNQYRIYLNKFGPLWRAREDRINLHDENGFVVDSIEIN